MHSNATGVRCALPRAKGIPTAVLNSLVKHQSSTQAKKQQQNSLVPEAKCQSDVYQAGRLKLRVGTVPFKNAGSAPALAA